MFRYRTKNKKMNKYNQRNPKKCQYVAHIFTPENSEELANNIHKLYANQDSVFSLGENGKHFVSVNFNREKIAKSFFTKLGDLNDT